MGICRVHWENRGSLLNHPRHICQQTGSHTYHKCRCSALKRNPHPDVSSVPVPFREYINALVEKWEQQCCTGYQWTSNDVADFVECNIKNFPTTGALAMTSEASQKAAFKEAMGMITMPPDGSSEYDEWLFNRGWQAATALAQQEIAELRKEIADLHGILPARDRDAFHGGWEDGRRKALEDLVQKAENNGQMNLADSIRSLIAREEGSHEVR